MRKIKFCDYEDLESYLKDVSSNKEKKIHNDRNYFEAYTQLKLNLLPVQEAETAGAMAAEIRKSFEEFSGLLSTIPETEKNKKINEFFDADHVVFLNDHGPNHIAKVIEHAGNILKHFHQELSPFETFILLCAIQIHDIGNALGRNGHEKNLRTIFEEKSKGIIIDSPERRIIETIAMSHGGKTPSGSKDTVSVLKEQEDILNNSIRPRLIASVLRFADELADDYTRANLEAIDLGILGDLSSIYHDYSKVLHTVSIEKNEFNNDLSIKLVYELDTEALKKKYNVKFKEKLLLDEIYERTFKMEQERRYCMKFMHSAVSINRIKVVINTYNSLLEPLPQITYTLEDTGYPGQIYSSIKDVNPEIPSGEEELRIILEMGV